MKKTNELEILRYNYWEHFKYAKELSLILGIDHPKRKAVIIEMNNMAKEIERLTNRSK